MGTYTTVLKLYKTAADEVVDVEQQMNYNWDISDLQMRRLLEYEYTTAAAPNVVGALSRSRFYKEYSNSFMAYFSGGNFFWQDPTAFVSPWVDATPLLQAGWFAHPEFPPAYRIVKKSGGTTSEIEWTGAIATDPVNPIQIDVNTNMAVIDIGDVPGDVRPVVSKYFLMNAGNTATNYSISRVFFNSNGSVEIKRYGANPTNPGMENRIEFTGIKYNVEVAA